MAKNRLYIFLILLTLVSISGCRYTDIYIRTQNRFEPTRGMTRTTVFRETWRDVEKEGDKEITSYVRPNPEKSVVKSEFILPKTGVKQSFAGTPEKSMVITYTTEYPDYKDFPSDIQKPHYLDDHSNIVHRNRIKLKKKRGFFKTVIVYEEVYPAEIIVDQKIKLFKKVYQKWSTELTDKLRKENKKIWSPELEKELDKIYDNKLKFYIKALKLSYKLIAATDKQEEKELSSQLDAMLNSEPEVEDEILAVLKKTTSVASISDINNSISETVMKNTLGDHILEAPLYGTYNTFFQGGEKYRFENRFKFRGKLVSTNGKSVKLGKDQEIVWHFQSSEFFLKSYKMRVEFQIINWGQIISALIILFIVIVILLNKQKPTSKSNQ